jgi:hypothetical protein
MAEAADFSMPDAFAKDYLDRVIKKTEKIWFFKHLCWDKQFCLELFTCGGSKLRCEILTQVFVWHKWETW